MSQRTRVASTASIAIGLGVLLFIFAPSAESSNAEKDSFVRQCSDARVFVLDRDSTASGTAGCSCVYDLLAKRKWTTDEMQLFLATQIKDQKALELLVQKNGRVWANSATPKLVDVIRGPDFFRCMM